MLIHALLAGSLFAHAAVFQGPVELAGISRADSSRLRRAAESAQRSFESFRRSRFPMSVGDGGGPCDVRIGRYCYWRGDDADEAPRSRRSTRRHETSRRVDRAARQYVGASVGRRMGRRPTRALLRRRASHGRRDSLRRPGAARGKHGARRSPVSPLTPTSATRSPTRSYGVALAAMELPERCRWLDITDLLDGPLADRFEHTPCDARDSLARQILTLGAPLYSVTTTDLLTEHLTGTASQNRRALGDVGWRGVGRRCATPRDALRLAAMVFARPSEDVARLARGTRGATGMPYDFLPSEHAVDHEARITSDDWTLDNRFARTGYAPAYARSMHDLPSQIARFRRGDSTLVVAAWDARQDTTLIGRPLRASLVVAGANSPAVVTEQDSAAATGRLVSVARADSGIVSLELLADHDRRAARRREGFTALEETLSRCRICSCTKRTRRPTPTSSRRATTRWRAPRSRWRAPSACTGRRTGCGKRRSRSSTP